jgi:hypothetical protein
LEAFYKDNHYTLAKFPNKQVFDFAGLAGRAFSSSYVPLQDTNTVKGFAILLKAIFDEHQENGQIQFYYETEVYLGQV